MALAYQIYHNETRYINCEHPGCGVEVPYTYGPQHRKVPKYCVPHRGNKFAAERRKLRAQAKQEDQ